MYICYRDRIVVLGRNGLIWSLAVCGWLITLCCRLNNKYMLKILFDHLCFILCVNTLTGPKQVQNITLIYPVLVEHLVISDLVQGQVYGFKVKAKNHQTMYGPNSDEATASPAAYGNNIISLSETHTSISHNLHSTHIFSESTASKKFCHLSLVLFVI